RKPRADRSNRGGSKGNTSPYLSREVLAELVLESLRQTTQEHSIIQSLHEAHKPRPGLRAVEAIPRHRDPDVDSMIHRFERKRRCIASFFRSARVSAVCRPSFFQDELTVKQELRRGLEIMRRDADAHRKYLRARLGGKLYFYHPFLIIKPMAQIRPGYSFCPERQPSHKRLSGPTSRSETPELGEVESWRIKPGHTVPQQSIQRSSGDGLKKARNIFISDPRDVWFTLSLEDLTVIVSPKQTLHRLPTRRDATERQNTSDEIKGPAPRMRISYQCGARLMEAVLKQLNNILELLAVSQTDRVRLWDRCTALRAFQWAEYCEQLHSRYHSSPPVRSALESGLSDANQRLQETFPSHSPVIFSELAQCQHKLLKNLLNNPSAPSFILEMFLDPKPASQESPVSQTALVTRKSAFSLLCRSLNRANCHGLATEPEARGSLLVELLSSLLTRSGNEDYGRTLLDSVMSDSAGKTGSFYDVIAAALLSGADESKLATQRFLLSWLQDHEARFGGFCSHLSPKLGAVLSQRSAEFKLAYWGVLKRWARRLVYDATESVWVTSEGVASFNALTDRLREFFISGAPLKEETEAELEALREEDGAFSVAGLSVWTDLILQLSMHQEEDEERLGSNPQTGSEPSVTPRN
ncbi:hypothetical protein DNTS_011895, partial [Danionella cerebrum]